MALKLYLPKADAHLFVKLLREHVPELNARYPDEGVSFLVEDFQCEMGDDSIAVARSGDGWLYRMTIYIDHPKIYDPTVWESEERGYRAGKASIEVTPLSPNIHAANIRVSIDYDPPDEAPEVVLLFLEVFEPMEQAWGGVMKQLGEQSAVLKDAIAEKYGEVWERMSAIEEISDATEMVVPSETEPLPPAQDAEATDDDGEPSIEEVTLEQAEALLEDKATMLEYADPDRGYEVATALAVIKAMTDAWPEMRLADRWGPAFIVRYCKIGISKRQVTHYLKAAYNRGMRKVNGVRIPYKPRHDSSHS